MVSRGPLLVVLLTVLLPLLCVAYEEDEGLYPWPPRGLRAAPSMRLRFGKRGPGVWGLTQRSMPSLRMRFGKRGSYAQEDMSELPGVEDVGDMMTFDELAGPVQTRGGGRSPGLRLRFGKRDAPLEKEVEEEVATARQ